MTWRVIFTPAAQRQLRKLPRPAHERVLAIALLLAEDPRPHGAIRLAGTEEGWRVRVGDYRILYEIVAEEILVQIVRVAHRREAYR
jgi:mRNA interferase RelE/StbE